MLTIESARKHVRTYMRMAKAYVEELSKYDQSIVYDPMPIRQEADDTLMFKKGGKFVGFVDAKVERLKSGKDILYIAEFYVDPDYRRAGVGTEMMKAILDIWEGDIYLYILMDNEPAMDFWNAVERHFGLWRVFDKNYISFLQQNQFCEIRVFRQKLMKGE